MKTVYIELNFSHKSFTTEKTAIVAMDMINDGEYFMKITNLAKAKICNKLGLNEEEVIIFGWRCLGENVVFI